MIYYRKRFLFKTYVWRSRIITDRGKHLLRTINRFRCKYHSTGNPTYRPTDRSSIYNVKLFCPCFISLNSRMCFHIFDLVCFILITLKIGCCTFNEIWFVYLVTLRFFRVFIIAAVKKRIFRKLFFFIAVELFVEIDCLTCSPFARVYVCT